MGLHVLEHDHDGRCSGRLRHVDGRLVREVACDDCGTVVEKADLQPYQVPMFERQAA